MTAPVDLVAYLRDKVARLEAENQALLGELAGAQAINQVLVRHAPRERRPAEERRLRLVGGAG